MAFVEDRWTRKDRTRKPEYGKGLRWRVVWDEDGTRKTKSFKGKEAAERHKTFVEHRKHSGGYVSPQSKRAMVADLIPVWEASLIRLKPSTRGDIAYTVRAEILPKWGTWQVGMVTRQALQAWVHDMHASGKATNTTETIYGRFRVFMYWCVTEGHIAVNPCRDIVMPTRVQREHIFLDLQQAQRLLEEIPENYRLLVETMLTTGIRFGEAAEARLKDLDAERGRLRINRSITRGQVTTPKSHKRREVPLTPSLTQRLAESMVGKEREALLFTTDRGRQLRDNNFRRHIFGPAVARAGLPEGLRPHDLRHTAAALAVASGANVKVIQRMLGHASAALTLDLYAGLFEKDLDDVATRMGRLLFAIDAPEKHLDERSA